MKNAYFCNASTKNNIMQIIKIEILNEKAMTLLLQLEQLNILRLVGDKKKENTHKQQWAGVLARETAHKMLNEVDVNRNEWERNT